MRICPDCGCPEAVWIQEVRYPGGAVTAILDCPVCARLVLAEQLPAAN